MPLSTIFQLYRGSPMLLTINLLANIYEVEKKSIFKVVKQVSLSKFNFNYNFPSNESIGKQIFRDGIFKKTGQ